MEFQSHEIKLRQLQNALKKLSESKQKGPFALDYKKRLSNTARSKDYKHNLPRISFESFNEILQIDTIKQRAYVEPRVSMQSLVKATLAHSLIPAIVPEFKGITVGGAIMGSAAESSSHRWGCFNDTCLSYDILCGDGQIIHASPHENQEIYYGIPGSYGSIGTLTSAEILLVPVDRYVFIQYTCYSSAHKAIENIDSLLQRADAPDFIEGILFKKNQAVVIEGYLRPPSWLSNSVPLFSFTNPLTSWFYQHVQDITSNLKGGSFKEKMTIEDFLFRYDLGAFWVGGYLFQPRFLWEFITQGIYKYPQRSHERINNAILKQPSFFNRAIWHPYLNSQALWNLFHKAERWIQNRMIIQDLCIPMSNAQSFCENLIKNIFKDAIDFPIWLCPIKKALVHQLFAPHSLPSTMHDKYLLNFGLYGIPKNSGSVHEITKKLEQRVRSTQGRKVLYGRSYYTLEEFWNIYSRSTYEDLRKKTAAREVWEGITEKVLSE